MHMSMRVILKSFRFLNGKNETYVKSVLRKQDFVIFVLRNLALVIGLGSLG